jgi:ribosome assembly protein 4
MATVAPPPSKRRRLEQAERSKIQQEPIPDNTIRIRFYDRSTNEPIGPSVAVSLPQATVSNLNILANSLQGVEESSERVPYDISWEKQGSTEGFTLASNGDIYSSLVKPGAIGTEDELALFISPQAVFRVKAVSRCASSISGHAQPILTAQFSPGTSSRFATGSGDFTARIWDCDTGTPMHTLSGHTGWVLCVAYSPDNTMIATGSYDNTVRLWEAGSGKSLGGALKGHTKFIRSLAWEPYHIEQQGRPRVASSSKDGTVRIWDVIGKKMDIMLSGHKASVSCVKWGGTGLIYTASQDRTIKVWDSKDGRLLHTLESHAHWVNHLALSTDSVLRTAFHDHTGKTPSSTGEKVAKAEDRFKKAATIGKRLVERLVSASDDNVVYLWDPLSSNPTKPVARLNGHQKAINHVTFSPDGQYIASASFDNSVKLWNARDGKFLQTLRGHVAPVYQVVFSPDSRLLVSCSKDTTLKCWDVKTGKLHRDLPGHQDEVFAVDWSPDGEKVGSGGKDKAVRLWRH